jgi:hypothetical protein
MASRLGRFGCILLALGSAATAARAAGPEPELVRLKEHVATLASPAFEGRRGEGGRKAAAYVEDAFKDLGLEPLFDGRFTQEVPDGRTGAVLGRNVGAKLVGADPGSRDDWIIVAAHFDHLGVRNGVLYPGADDNASGVAMMLEVARCLRRSGVPPRRSVMFLGFDLEEDGLVGSRYFVEHMPIPLRKVALFVTADMIGRSLGGICGRSVFVMGTEHAPGLRPWVEEAARGRDLDVGVIGSDLLLFARSDYGPFRAREVPFLFFSTGENPHYHRPSDVAETLDYAKLEAISRVIFGVVRRAAGAGDIPRWERVPDHPIGEAVAIREVFRALLAHRDELQIKPAIVALMTGTLRRLDAAIARGVVTPGERSGLIRVSQVVLFSVF